MRLPDLSDAELLFLEAIGASEAGDQARARDLLHLAHSLSGEGPPFGQSSPVEAGDAEERTLPPRRTPGGLATPDDVDDAELLLQDAIEAAGAGNRALARDLLGRGLILDEGNLRGWLWLSGVVEEPQDRAFCLRRVLELDPGNELARQALAWLPEQERDHEPVQEPPQGQASSQEQASPLDQHAMPGAGTATNGAAAGLRPAETGVETVAGKGARPVVARSRGDVGLFLRSEFTLIAGLGLVLLALIVWAHLAGEGGLPLLLSLLQVLLGLAFVLFVPGYALQAALFPRKDALGGLGRLVLSFGLSVALALVLALVLDRLPWGLRLGPIVAAEGLATILLSEVALLRRWRLPLEERPALVIRFDRGGRTG